jgi:hypothetical protein
MISLRYRFSLFLNVLFILNRSFVTAQQGPSLEELLPGLRDRAIIVDITARIVEQNQQVVWHSQDSKVTIPGRPVGIKLVGSNIVVAVQFTPYFRSRGNNFLVAQGQVWIDVPNKGISYHTSMQTIPMEFNEEVYFFPLGSGDLSGNTHEEARIEIQLMIRPYISESSETRQGKTSPP